MPPATTGEDGAERPDSRRNIDLERLKQDYEGRGKSLAQLCDEYGISAWSLRMLVREQRWRPRRPATVDRASLIGRLFYLLERKIDYLERDMDETNAAESAELGRMVASLDKLIAIEQAEAGRRGAKVRKPSKGMLEIRAQVARRLAQFGK